METNRPFHTVASTSLNHLDVADVPGDIDDTLSALIQRKEDLETEYLMAMEDQLFTNELSKPPEAWISIKRAKTELAQSEEIEAEIESILGSRINRCAETVGFATDALETLRDKMAVLSQKHDQLQQKFAEMVDLQPSVELPSSDDELETVRAHHLGLKRKKENIHELLTAAKAEMDILRKRTGRMEITQQHLEEFASSYIQRETASKKELDFLKEKLTELEDSSGLRCHMKDDLTIDIDFLCGQTWPSTDLSKDEEVTVNRDSQLTVTLTFRENEESCLELADVQTNQEVKGADAIIQAAKVDKDLSKLLLELRKLWTTYVPLVTEIAYIRQRHAIDWSQESHVLQLMVRKSSSVICSLKVPDAYPYAGQIVLENVMGGSTDLTVEDITPPSDISLRGWVLHLEGLFGHQ